MKLSQSLLAIPALSLIIAAGVASGACSASVGVTIPGDAVVAYTGTAVVPDGIVFGTTVCTGDIYFDFSGGYGFCDDGIWDYTDLDPTSFGDYTLDTGIVGGSDTGSQTGSDTGSNTGSDTGSNTSSDTNTSGSGTNTSGSDTNTSGSDTNTSGSDTNTSGSDTSTGATSSTST